jgi:carbon monoxide dehydrogenase subunit G
LARIEVMTHVEAPPQRVWDVLTDWERQAEWMADVRHIAVISAHREGTGVTLRANTDILGVVVRDELQVTQWEPPSVLGVRHLGRLIAGVAAFELTPTPSGTRLVWWEEAAVPLGGVGDAVAGLVLAPWIRRVFRRSVAHLKRLCEAPPV